MIVYLTSVLISCHCLLYFALGFWLSVATFFFLFGDSLVLHHVTTASIRTMLWSLSLGVQHVRVNTHCLKAVETVVPQHVELKFRLCSV